ncbi:MAG: 2-oxoglutarate dehydrogenase E1 component, partial [Anaerolineae bacterium]|nr:2-oxoglutarate dehydrogenase E1 component [Anaerolineae bacterium]
IDWGHAESLAFASILTQGTPIRMTGQDVGRGTFSQRHAVLHDYETGSLYIPLQHLRDARASFEIHDSPLSENAVLGFEYGYTLHAGEVLVLWEAQYGDFINGAQVIVDQFIASAKVKWADMSGMVMLLPHGYEGQGPEHSSARLERFLELAAENNLRIANCTTAAQYFHLLRRQAGLLRVDPRPLVLMTPKSLLRHPLAASPVEAFTQGAFQPVIDDDVADRELVERVILCSGKVYVDLVTARQRPNAEHVALVRVEQIYPFPAAEIRGVLDRYPNLREVVWLQEEPANMGAWRTMRPRLRELLAGVGELLGRPLTPRYMGRRERASPAEGSAAWHQAEQRRIVEAAFTPITQHDTSEVQHGD